MFQRSHVRNETVIEFGYVRSEGRNGEEWHLAFLVVDSFVVQTVGLEKLDIPPFLERHPQSILRQLYRVLNEHKLDGGSVDEWPSDSDSYGVTITIKERILKPNH